MPCSKPIHISLDTSSARNIQKIGFTSHFIDLVRKKNWMIVTTLFVEREMKKQQVKVLEKLDKEHLLYKHSSVDSSEEEKQSEEVYYDSLKPIIKEADAQLLAVSITYRYHIITDDFNSLKVFSERFPRQYKMLRYNSTVHIICAAEMENIISQDTASDFYEKYKSDCFDDIYRTPAVLRACDYNTIKIKYGTKIF